jgi:GNAT superfamily N-acetyltransferase
MIRKINMNKYVVRAVTAAEMDWLIQQAAEEGWNPGLHDGGCFLSCDPQGFLIGILDGKPIGCISAVGYTDQFGFIGLYIVRGDYRGQGYGLPLWQAAMAHLEGCNIGLDGVPAQVPKYLKSGFHPAYNNFRFEGSNGGEHQTDCEGLVSLKDLPFETIREYDRKCFPADRTLFLREWLKLPEAYSAGCWEGGRLRGYGVLRKCRQGYKIGPLFADDGVKAEKLFLALITKTGQNTLFYLDVPEPNTAAMALARKYKMRQVFATARMYTGGLPDIALERVFGVTTFELG